ncbi:MAG: hypothetical protein COX06_02620, partial [Candidatus Zambryskibacteria bacterium CG22_combo_CG10-13_8_21_14_all_42_17]
GVEPVMQEALDGKLSEFGGEADAYRKKSEDMRMLTALEKKRENDESFTKDDLVLLYEITVLSKDSDIRKTRVSSNFGKEEIPKKTCSSYLNAPKMRSLTC